MRVNNRQMLSVSTALVMAPSSVLAQQLPAQEAASAAAPEDLALADGFYDINVTATRRITNLQNVPATIDVGRINIIARLPGQEADVDAPVGHAA